MSKLIDAKHMARHAQARELGQRMIELMASEEVQKRIRRNFPGWIAPEMKCMKNSGKEQPVHAWVKLVKLPKVMVLYGQGKTATEAVYNALERNYGQLMLPEELEDDLPF
jgi:hypothetical protein